MARLESLAKAGRYPTPPEIIPLLASNFVAPYGGSLLDICCAQGEAARDLGQGLGLKTWGNEIQADVQEYGPQNLDHWAHGPAEFLSVEGQCSLMLLNPPYEQEGRGRLETSFLKLAAPMIAPFGGIIIIVPLQTARDYSFQNALATDFDHFTVRRFPDPLYDRFHQIVIFADKRQYAYRNAWTGAIERLVDVSNDRLIPQLKGHETRITIPAGSLKTLKVSQPSLAEALTLVPTAGVQATQVWKDFTAVPARTGAFVPAQKLRPGHIAMLIGAGMLNGCKIETPEGTLLVKGFAKKEFVEIDRHVGEKSTTITEQEKMPIHLIALNLRSGTFEEHDSLKTPDKFEAFINTHLETLYRWVEENYPPLYPGDIRQPGHWKTLPEADLLAKVHGPTKLPGVPVNGLFGGQLETDGTLAAVWKKYKVAFLSGEQGVGKTCTSAALAAMVQAHGKKDVRLVVLSPANIVPKWAREVEISLREFGAWAVIARTISDVEEAFAKPGLGFIITSFENGKLGSGWEPVVARKQLIVTEKRPYPETGYHKVRYKVLACPTCGRAITEYSEEELAEFKCFCDGTDEHPGCGHALFTAGQASGQFRDLGQGQITTNKKGRMLEVGLRRFPIAEYISKKHPSEYYLILDECHKHKGSETAQAYAATDLLTSCVRAVMMTGTLYGGKAGTIFHLLYRGVSQFRQMYAHNEDTRFVSAYGLQQIKTTVPNASAARYTSFNGYTGRKDKRTFREIPGCNPALISLLLPYTAFLRLEDLGIELPSQTEHVLPVKLTDEMADIYRRDLGKLLDAAKDQARYGSLGVYSAYLQAALGWVDHPDAEEITVQINKKPRIFPIAAAANTLRSELPKVTAVADDILAEFREGRLSVVFCEQVHKRDPIPAFEKALRGRGLNPFVMRQTVKPEDREAAFKSAIAAGYNAFVMNGSLVELGMDMVELRNIYRTGINYSPYSVDQQNRRTHRLGKTGPSRVHFAYYENTLQEKATYLMASKLAAMAMLSGDVAEGLAAMATNTDTFMSELMKTVMRDERLTRPTHLLHRPAARPAPRPAPEAPAAPEIPARNVEAVALPPGKYIIAHIGLGTIEIRNGRTLAQLGWLGGEEVYGAAEAYLGLAKRAALTSRSTRKRWVAEVELSASQEAT